MRTLSRLLLASAAVCTALPAHADMAGKWTATSTASMAVTGDIALRDNALIFGNGSQLKLAPVAEREGMWSPLPERRPGAIYRVTPPSDPKLLRGNALCGKPVTYIVLSQRSENSLVMSVFASPKEPTGFGDESCAAYFYER